MHTKRDSEFPSYSRRGCFSFSSRRRHTRWPRDWSSDVCSSDLPALERIRKFMLHLGEIGLPPERIAERIAERSEERRVGKECRSRWGAEHEKKKGDTGRRHDHVRGQKRLVARLGLMWRGTRGRD